MWDIVRVPFCVARAVFSADPLCVECHFVWQAQYLGHSTLYTPRLYTFYTLDFSLPTLRFTLYSTLKNFALHTLYSALHTRHFTLRTLDLALHTLHFTLHSLHCTALHASRFTLYTSRFTVDTPLYTLHSTEGHKFWMF